MCEMKNDSSREEEVTMKRLSMIVLSIVLLFVGITIILSSCGGGGGGGGSSLPSIALKTDNVRIEQPNDSWTHSVAGTIISGGTTYNVTGTQTTLVLPSTKSDPFASNHACKVEYSSTTIVVNSNPQAPELHYKYFDQDGAGNSYTYGEGDGSTDKWITSPTSGYILDVKSPVSIGDNYSRNVTYSNGDTQTFSATVIGKEYVTTDVANYESYKATMTETTNYASGSITKEVLTGTVWMVPGITLVKQEANIKRYIGSTLDTEINVTFTLSSTNISY
jgi:hypothetical protein